MTVQELIRELGKLDPTLEVYVEGYEDGYTDVSTNKMQHIEVCRDFYNDQEGGKD